MDDTILLPHQRLRLVGLYALLISAVPAVIIYFVADRYVGRLTQSSLLPWVAAGIPTYISIFIAVRLQAKRWICTGKVPNFLRLISYVIIGFLGNAILLFAAESARGVNPLDGPGSALGLLVLVYAAPIAAITYATIIIPLLVISAILIKRVFAPVLPRVFIHRRLLAVTTAGLTLLLCTLIGGIIVTAQASVSSLSQKTNADNVSSGGLHVSLDAPIQKIRPGQTATFSGTLHNSSTKQIALNSYTSSPIRDGLKITADPLSSYVPSSLDPGQSWNGTLLEIDDSSAIPEEYAGNFTIYGGSSDSEASATVGFGLSIR